MKIAMMGTDYVGLVSGACFSEFGHHVVCIDKDASKIESLKAGCMPIYEPGLAEVIADKVKGDGCPLPPRSIPAYAMPTRFSLQWELHHGAAMAMPICPMCSPPRKKLPRR